MPEPWPGRFFDGRRAVEIPVTVVKGGVGIVIRSLNGHITQHWRRDIIVDGGRDPDGSVALRNDDAVLLVAAEAATALLGKRSAWSALPRVRIGWTVGACALGFCTLLLILLAPQVLVPLVPDVVENAIGANVQTELLAGKRPCDGAAGLKVLQALTSRLGNAAGVGGSVRVVVADSGTINAFTLPGKRIVLMRGLIDATDDPEELAGVLGHEMGHVAHADVMRLLLQRAGLGALGSLFSVGGGPGTLSNVSQLLLTLAYSRKAEAAADEASLEYLSHLGLRQDGLYRMLGVLKSREGGFAPAWLLTHPATDLRIAATQRPVSGANAMTLEDWQAVRAVCHEESAGPKLPSRQVIETMDRG